MSLICNTLEKTRMSYKKNLIACAIAAAFVPAAHAEIELGSGFSVTGFLDMSSTYADVDGLPNTIRSTGIDQFEADFLFEGSSGVSAEVDIEYGENSAGGPGQDDTFVEQAFVTKAFTDKFSLKMGRFLSYTGWETEEPTGLFQYSGVGYAPYFYGYYQQGVSAYYDGGTVDFMASVVNNAFDPLERDTDPNTELGVAISPGEGNFTAKLFYTENDDDDVTNFWASYKVGKVTLAAEYVARDYGTGDEGDGYLLMANFATGAFGFTARYGDYGFEDPAGVSTLETDSFTLSPSYKVGDNLLLVGEYRMDSTEGGPDVDTLAFEALFMF
jgi:hypothetical protein